MEKFINDEKLVAFYKNLKQTTYNISENMFPFPVELISYKMNDENKLIYVYLLDKLRLGLPDIVTQVNAETMSLTIISDALFIPKNKVEKALKELQEKYNLINYEMNNEDTFSYFLFDYHNLSNS